MRPFLALLMVLVATPPLRAQPAADTLAGVPFGDYAPADARAVRADPAGRLYVADAAGAVVVLAPDGALLRRITGDGQHAFVAPEDVDPTNGLLLLVADGGAGRIFRLGADGLGLEPFGPEGAPRVRTFQDPPRADGFAPVAVAAAGGNVFALDGRAGALVRWDVSRQRRLLAGPDDGLLDQPRALAATDDALFVLDARGVRAFDAFGTPGRRFGQGGDGAARRVRVLGGRIALVRAQRLDLYNAEGGLETSLVWTGPPLRDAALVPGSLILLTARALYRVPR